METPKQELGTREQEMPELEDVDTRIERLEGRIREATKYGDREAGERMLKL